MTLTFCPGCGLLLRQAPGEADCDNWGSSTDLPIKGEFEQDQAEKLIEVG